MKTRHIFSTALAIVLALTMVLGLSPAAGASHRGYRLGLSDQWTHIPFHLADDFEPRLGTSSKLSPMSPADFEEGKAATRPKVPVLSGRTVFDPRDEHFGSATWLQAKKHPKSSLVPLGGKRFSRSRWNIRWAFTPLGAVPRADYYGLFRTDAS